MLRTPRPDRRPGRPVVRLTLAGGVTVALLGAVSAPATAAATEAAPVKAPTTANWGWE